MDISTTFGCLPPSSDNEWLNLRGFVEVYNSTYGTNYNLKFFPEKDNRSVPQPEVLLSDGEKQMVIERKVFAWPPDYIRYHQLWHEFNGRFVDKAAREFTDDIYVFEITKADIPNKKMEVVELVNDVVCRILKHKGLVSSTGGIVCVNEPIEWKFYRLPEVDRDDYYGECGIIVRLMRPFNQYSSEQVVIARKGIKAAVTKLIKDSAPKFNNFTDCLKVLVVEPYTDILNISPGMLDEIMQGIKLPANIDQVWLAVQIELNDWKSEIDYRLVRGK